MREVINNFFSRPFEAKSPETFFVDKIIRKTILQFFSKNTEFSGFYSFFPEPLFFAINSKKTGYAPNLETGLKAGIFIFEIRYFGSVLV